MGQECLGRDAVVEAAGTGGNVWTLSGRSLRSGCWFPQNFCGNRRLDFRVFPSLRKGQRQSQFNVGTSITLICNLRIPIVTRHRAPSPSWHLAPSHPRHLATSHPWHLAMPKMKQKTMKNYGALVTLHSAKIRQKIFVALFFSRRERRNVSSSRQNIGKKFSLSYFSASGNLEERRE